jgi:hypothetical protein
MADKITVEMGGQSKYQVAHQIANNIITVIDKKSIGQVTRVEYLSCVAEAIKALDGLLPSK